MKVIAIGAAVGNGRAPTRAGSLSGKARQEQLESKLVYLSPSSRLALRKEFL